MSHTTNFRLAVGIVAVEARDRRLRHRQARRIDGEVVIADDHPRKSVHDHAVALLRHDVEDDSPARPV